MAESEPAPAIATEDRQWIARQLRNGAEMTDICQELGLDAAAVVQAHRLHQRGHGKASPVAPAPADNGSGCYLRKNCAKCRERFTTTPRRRALCSRCFLSADDGGGDPGDGDTVGDLRVLV